MLFENTNFILRTLNTEYFVMEQHEQDFTLQFKIYLTTNHWCFFVVSHVVIETMQLLKRCGDFNASVNKLLVVCIKIPPGTTQCFCDFLSTGMDLSLSEPNLILSKLLEHFIIGHINKYTGY